MAPEDDWCGGACRMKRPSARKTVYKLHKLNNTRILFCSIT